MDNLTQEDIEAVKAASTTLQGIQRIRHKVALGLRECKKLVEGIRGGWIKLDVDVKKCPTCDGRGVVSADSKEAPSEG